MSLFSPDETLDDLAMEGATDTQIKFRSGLKLLLTAAQGLRTQVANDAVDPDDATDLVTHVASLLKSGRKVITARQPLQLESLTASGARAIGTSESSDEEKIVRAIVDELSSRRPDEQTAILAQFRDALDGKLDDIADVRRQLSDAQRSLTKYKPVIDALDKVKDSDKPTAVKRAIDGVTNTVTPGTGVPQDKYDAVAAERDQATSQINGVHEWIDKLKANFRTNRFGRSATLEFDGLDQSDLDPFELTKKSK